MEKVRINGKDCIYIGEYELFNKIFCHYMSDNKDIYTIKDKNGNIKEVKNKMIISILKRKYDYTNTDICE